MCGSGRFLVEFAKRGFDIDGFDLSPDMINRCEGKIKGVNCAGQLSCCDFSAYHPERRYDFIFIAAGSFCLLIEEKDILFSFSQMKDWLQPGGRILMEIETDLNYRNKSTEGENNSTRSVKENAVAIIFKSNTSYDSVKSVAYSQNSYELFEKGVFVAKEEEDFYLKLYRKNEFETFVAAAGLIIQNSYTDFTKNKFHGQDSESIIYLLT